MKRFFCASAAVALLISLSACGSTMQPSQVPEETIAPTSTTSPVIPPEITEAPVAEKGPYYVSLLTYTTYDNSYSSDDSLLLVNGYCEGVIPNPNDENISENLRNAISDFSNEYLESWRNNFAMTTEGASGYYEDMGYSYGLSSVENSILVRRADSTAVSFLLPWYYFAGGAHPTSGNNSVCFDSESGKQLTLGDVFTDTSVLPDIISEILLSEYGNGVFFDDNPASYITGMIKEGIICWTLDPEAVTFWFSPYDIAPYAFGSFSVVLPFEEYSTIMNEKYTAVPDSWVSYLGNSSSGCESVVYDSNEKNISIYGGSYDGYAYNSVTISINGDQTLIDDVYSFDFTPFYLSTENGSYIYLALVSENDYQSILWFNTSSKQSGIISNLGAAFYIFEEADLWGRAIITDPYVMPLASRLDVFRTTDGYKNYTVSVLGDPVSEENEYIICSPFVLTSKVELEVRVLDKAFGEPDYDEIVPSGTDFTVYATDGKTFIEAKTPDYESLRVYGSFYPWPQAVSGGYEAEEAFDGVMYAG